MTRRTPSPVRRALGIAAAAVAIGLGSATLSAGEGDPLAEPPEWPLPADRPAVSGALRDGWLQAIETLRAGGDADRCDAAVRNLADGGERALPLVVEAIRGAPWRLRAALMGAVAEMDARAAGPILVAGSRDPSFAVREAAVAGLGKTAGPDEAAALVARADPATEPSWRVRAAAAVALRRATLRGALDAARGGAALTDLLADDDVDVRRIALDQIAPLAVPGALPALLETFRDASRSARERELALRALRAYRTPAPELLAALRTGFVTGETNESGARAGRALLEIRGASALDEPEISDAALRHLAEEGAQEIRDVLGRLGHAASPWIADRVAELARRIASGRVEHVVTPFDTLLDALIQVDEARGVETMRALLGGPDAASLDRETRLAVLRRAQSAYARTLRGEIRGLWGTPGGADIQPELLRAIAASRPDDLGALVTEALGSRKSDVRGAAMDVLDTTPSLPTPDALRTLAASAPRPAERGRALSSLARREPSRAAAIAVELLGHPDPQMRQRAIDAAAGAPSPGVLEALLTRFAAEDGSEAPRDPPKENGNGGGAVTGSGERPTELNRRRLRAALVGAIARVGGAASRAALFGALDDADPAIRASAAVALVGLASADDAPRLLARIDAEEADGIRDDLIRALARLSDAPAAAERFSAWVAEPRTRSRALRILAEDRSEVVPAGIESGLTAEGWSDDDRAAALAILERADRAPPAEQLTGLARSARSLALAAEAVRVLASRPGAATDEQLLLLLRGSEDPERAAFVVRALGERRTQSALPALLVLFESTSESALAASDRGDARLQLHRTCAAALGRIGGDAAVRALVSRLLDPALAAAGGRRSVPANGPFQPEESALVTGLRALVAAAALADDASLARAIDETIAARDAAGQGASLDKEYLDGVARFLHDPLAFQLPPRRRPAAAARLWRRAARTAPRWSPLDADALEYVALDHEEWGRFAEAAVAYRASLASADVEDALRPASDRRWEQARLAAFDARAAAAAGRMDEAVAATASIRAPDPTDGDLAFRAGWLRVKLGRPDADAEAALLHAVARNTRDASAQFFAAWVAEKLRGPAAAVPLYEASSRADLRNVEDLGTAEYLTHRRGRRHRWGHHAFWLARALASSGRGEDALPSVRAAILLDDRFAAQALQDPALAGVPDLAGAVAEALAEIPADPLR